MASVRRKHGSVLLLAIGLLTIITILASTFLIISNLDANETEILSAKREADPIAEGIVATVQGCIAADVFADANTPYALVEPSASGWKNFIDCPYQDPAFNRSADVWLSTEYDIYTSHWEHLSNVLGATTDKGQATHQFFNNIAKTSDTLVDADGDGNTADSYLFETGVTNVLHDKEYYAAVRVVDLAARICVNTAAGRRPGTTTTEPELFATRGPIHINLRGFVGEQAYADIHERRVGKGSSSLRHYEYRCARRLLSPVTGYSPYGIGDEMFLLWSEPLHDEPITNTGFLSEDLTSMGQDAIWRRKRRLTTFSSTRAVARPNPDYSFTELELLSPDEGDAQATYKRMVAMLGSLNIANDTAARKKMAAHFVANLRQYMSTDSNQEPQSFTPEGESFTVYGLRQDLVITEVFARHKGPTDADPNAPDDSFWGCAIELMNPSRRAISLARYTFTRNGNTVTLASGKAIPASDGNTPQKVVIYNCGWGEDYEGGEEGIFNTDPNNWVKANGLDLRGGLATTFRIKYGNVPVDEVTAKELQYDVPRDQIPFGTEETRDIRRDDRMVQGESRRARYNLAVYKRLSNHALGSNNGLGDNDLNQSGDTTSGKTAQYSAPIFRRGEDPPGIIGAAVNVYLVGPIADSNSAGGGGFPQRILRDDVSEVLQDSPTRGRLAVHPTNINYGGYAPGIYPDVPPGTLFHEFFTPVPAHRNRLREKTRVYGLLNVNTASAEALRYGLPWPTIDGQYAVRRAGRTYTYDPNTAANYIVAYRDRNSLPDTRNYNNRSHANGSNITNLRNRTQSNIDGFLTPGEVAVPLADYMDTVMGISDTVRKCADYVRARNALYTAISDCVTTRSDVFAAYVRVQLTNSRNPRFAWYYVAIIDRSNVQRRSDTPALLMFSEAPRPLKR